MNDQRVTGMASTIDEDDIEKLNEMLDEKIPMMNIHVYYIFALALQKNNDTILQMLYEKFLVEQLVEILCERDDMMFLEYSIRTSDNFKRKVFNNIWNLLDMCATFNSVNVCEFLIEHKDDATEPISNTATLLHTASFWTHIEIVKLYCQYNFIEINEVNYRKESALHIACKVTGNLEIVKILLNAKIDVNLTDKYNCTAFSNACYYEADDIVRYLLSVKSELNLSIDEDHKSVKEYKLKYPNVFRD